MIRKILLVDDDQVLQLTLSRKMAEFDEQFRVIQAVDGFDALKKLEESAVSLVITDLMMPRMDGMSLISHIQNKYHDLPVIILSGIKREDVPNIEQVQGIIAYLEKPVAINELLELILNTLEEETKGGVMHNVSPTMFMQMMEMEEKSCTIRMLDNGSDEGGILYLINGQVMDARVGPLKGIDALQRIFFWNEVTVFLRHECAPRANVINSDIQPVMMAALAAKDELEQQTTADNDAKGEDNAAVQIEALRVFLEGELGGQATVGAIYQAEKMVGVQKRLNDLGANSGFGSLKAGHIIGKQGKNTLLVPGSPPTLLEVKPDSPVEAILDVLKKTP